MRLNSLLFSLLLVLNCFGIAAQSVKRQTENYEYARQLIEQQKFAQAVQVLEPIAKNNSGPLEAYARHLQAYANSKSGETNQAISQLKSLVNDFASWNKIDESRYLLVHLLFEKNNLDEAFTVCPTDSE